MSILANSSRSVRADSKAESNAPPVSASRKWQSQLKQAIRDSTTLVKALDLPASWPNFGESASADRPLAAEKQFPVFVPQPYLSRIKRGDPNDPLLLQVIPQIAEEDEQEGFVQDPLGEAKAKLGPGLLQKYHGRVLMVTTGTCAIHCRYCFRRHFPYSESPRSVTAWEPAIQQIEQDPTIVEVLLSGGDPLTLVDSILVQLMERLESIPHLKRLRIHSRLPIVLPARVTDELCRALNDSRLNSVVVVHANHPNEIDADVKVAFARLHAACGMVLNQSVLLRGVNDDANSLVKLSERLIESKVMPYYLHQLDPVSGAAHFKVDIETGKQLIAQMRAQLPGFAVPRYVQEIAGEPNKTVLC